MVIFKSDSDTPYTERQYVKFGRTKDLNKWESLLNATLSYSFKMIDEPLLILLLQQY